MRWKRLTHCGKTKKKNCLNDTQGHIAYNLKTINKHKTTAHRAEQSFNKILRLALQIAFALNSTHFSTGVRIICFDLSNIHTNNNKN